MNSHKNAPLTPKGREAMEPKMAEPTLAQADFGYFNDNQDGKISRMRHRSAARVRSLLSMVCGAFRHNWLFRGYVRTFSPFHRGVVTAYALEVGAA